ncbi:phosphoribosylglycinamide formyltransferase [Candidatus Thioglobus sp.]|jgi:formyltetrahydrofolate-dependent phosphoribosylglycinamide formyltransferase (EC 2.1.2.2)|uniref:phosphoribosylglycinamide formyltransferase n=1 Tax=Candidatus Thioglobus sp. TaxID=2026721 RepID=UPI001762BEED|nr:phosphoribosylglycinamide formyltransferase [Candidatus Thioglobus sp.]
MDGVVLISGSGSNLQSIIDNADDINLKINCVISNKSDAYGLKRAQKAGISTHTIKHDQFPSRGEFDKKLSSVIDVCKPEIIILAGFMRILSTEFTKKYCGKMLNIHPSLLPKFQGLNTHQRVIESGEKEHGVSIHFVTEELDGGPVIAQSTVAILENDNAKSLAERVLAEEHKLYPEVIHWFTQGRLKFKNSKAVLDGKVL